MTGRRDVLIAGAGLSGAVIARQLAEAGHRVTVIEERAHVAGNCHTERDPETGVLVHRYGPHIFHTADQVVWDYVNRFATFRPYRHRVWTNVGGEVFPLPITLGTINQFYNSAMSPQEAMDFIATKVRTDSVSPQSFEDQALAMVGPELYEAFFKGYTEKQWGCSTRDLPASILKRLPLRFTYDDSYFDHPYQAIPEGGYTPMVAAILDHANITIALKQSLKPADCGPQTHLFWSGPLDTYFGADQGTLGYRTLDFEHHHGDGDFQGCPVMNYGDADVPWTRITEHKHFAPWETHDKTVWTRETSRTCQDGDIPYYPIRLVQEKALLRDYVARAWDLTGVTFVGRLGTYRYLDMDVCISEALATAAAFLRAEDKGERLPAFVKSPL